MQTSSRRRLASLLAVVPLAAPLFGLGCGGGGEAAKKPTSPAPAEPVASVPPPAPKALEGVDVAAMDPSVNACEDFYDYACGGWMKATPIPEDEARWMRSFNVIQERNETRLHDILVAYAKEPPASQPYSKALGDYFASCIDEAAVEKAGLSPIEAELKRIEAIKDLPSLVKTIAHLQLLGVTAFFEVGSAQDFKDATQVVGVVDQGGLGLPDRDYYLAQSEGSKKIRDAYAAHVERMFVLAGDTPAQAKKHAKTVMAVETSLARASMSKVLRREPANTYHRVELRGLEEIAPAVTWTAYWAELGFPNVTAINAASPWFMASLSRMLDAKKKPDLKSVGSAAEPVAAAKTEPSASAKGDPAAAAKAAAPVAGVELKNAPLAELKTYLRYHLLAASAPLLPERFVQEDFAMKRELTGAAKLLPRWKRCVRAVDGSMGEALAQPFVKETLGAEGKGRALELIEQIEAAMHDNLDHLAWMDAPTRVRALEKLGLVANKIGYPDVWRSYDGLAIDRASYAGNVLAASAFEARRQLAKIGRPVDRNEWYMSPPTVNAYYDPSMNQMVFPAGILQPPFYSNRATDGINFGGIGMVMGHELTHGFDDEGRKFDGRGNLVEWWTPTVGTEFDKRAACVEKQFDAYTPIDGLHINGKLTLGENIADLGGIKLAHAALAKRLATHPEPKTGDFTPEQQLFLGYAQAWCGNMRPEMQRMRLMTDPHSPARYRVIGPLSNLPEFAQAFECKPGQAMVRPAAERCEVW
jgi:endothelin-converting enzyme/putative endopeptidase